MSPTAALAFSRMASVETIRLGVLGCGTVGTSLIELLNDQREEIARRAGVDLSVRSVVVRDTSKARAGLDSSLLNDDPQALVIDEDIDVVIELIGGIELPYELVQAALRSGKSVVTANKALLAAHGPELYALAADNGVDLLFEASVAAGIPLIRPLRESLIGERISRVMGILNGTTNFILTKMAGEGAGYAESLAEAKELGYAEADPTADVEGLDAGAKVAIIASLAFGEAVLDKDVYVEGITQVTAEDMAAAARMGYAIKLIGIAERHDDDSIDVRVHPAMVPLSHPLASVNGSFNAVFVEGPGIDQLMFFGRGAGGHPTAAMVLGDVIDAAVGKARGAVRPIGNLKEANVRSIDQAETAFYLSIDARDEPGVLSEIAGSFGEHGVSILSMEQVGMGDQARLLFITHTASESNLRATLADLEGLDAVKNVGQVLRVVGEDEPR